MEVELSVSAAIGAWSDIRPSKLKDALDEAVELLGEDNGLEEIVIVLIIKRS